MTTLTPVHARFQVSRAGRRVVGLGLSGLPMQPVTLVLGWDIPDTNGLVFFYQSRTS